MDIISKKLFPELWKNASAINMNLLDQKNKQILQTFEFEKWVDAEKAQLHGKYMEPYIETIAILYLAFVFLGPRLMENREAFDLKRPLIIWNWMLALFSLAGSLRMLPTIFHLVLFEPDGYYKSVCQITHFFQPDVFFGAAFAYSKLFELLDTVFIVLRKSPLIFLHWFHHVTMLLLAVYITPIGDPVTRWAAINYSVHTIMYSYYAIKAMGIRVPVRISKAITIIQISQFLCVLAAMIKASYIKLSGSRDCVLHPMTITYVICAATAYLALFIHFFVTTYIYKTSPKSKIRKMKNQFKKEN